SRGEGRLPRHCRAVVRAQDVGRGAGGYHGIAAPWFGRRMWAVVQGGYYGIATSPFGCGV
ncbi:hypothetical protein ACWEGX_15370, partial [Streptomyces chartreusis]